MAYIPLRFGVGNVVADSVLSASPAPVTDLDELKTEHRAELVLWENLSRDVVIEGRLSLPRAIDVLALPNSTLSGLDEVRLDLFSDDDLQTLVYSTGFQALAEPPEIGQWIVGVQSYGVPLDEDKPSAFVQWLPKTYICRSWRLVIRRTTFIEDSSSLALRMMVLASKVQLEQNFEYGFPIRFMTDPEIVRTASGSNVESYPQQESRELTLSLPMMSTLDRNTLSSMERRLGGAPFLVSALTDRVGRLYSDYAFLGRFDVGLTYGFRYEGIHRTSMRIVEV